MNCYFYRRFALHALGYHYVPHMGAWSNGWHALGDEQIDTTGADTWHALLQAIMERN